MGADPVYIFTCDICDATSQTQIEGEFHCGSVPPYTAQVPAGWWVSTTWVRIGLGDDCEDFEHDDEKVLTSFCRTCTTKVGKFMDDLTNFANQHDQGDQAESNLRMDKMVTAGGGHNGPYPPNKVTGHHHQNQETPVKGPESNGDGLGGSGGGKDLGGDSKDRTSPHRTIHGNHHYVRASNCTYLDETQLQTGYQCDTCAKG